MHFAVEHARVNLYGNKDFLHFSHKILTWDKMHTFFTFSTKCLQMHVTAVGDGTSYTTIHRRNTQAIKHAGILKFSSSVYIPM